MHVIEKCKKGYVIFRIKSKKESDQNFVIGSFDLGSSLCAKSRLVVEQENGEEGKRSKKKRK